MEVGAREALPAAEHADALHADLRRALTFTTGVLAALLALYVLLPRIAGVHDAWRTTRGARRVGAHPRQ